MLGEDVHRLLVSLAERQAAIGEAQRALHRLCELGLVGDGAVATTIGAPESEVTVAGTGGHRGEPSDASGASPGRGNPARQDARNGSGHGDSGEVDIARPEALQPGRDSKRRCAYAQCGKSFRPGPHGKKALYCSIRCRTRAAVARRRERQAAETRRQAAAVMAQAERDGFPSTLNWRNGDATSEA